MSEELKEIGTYTFKDTELNCYLIELITDEDNPIKFEVWAEVHETDQLDHEFYIKDCLILQISKNDVKRVECI